MNAIAFKQISVESSENPQAKVITVLREAINTGSLSQVGENLTYGNRHSIRLLDGLEEVKAKLERITTELESERMRAKSHDDQIRSLNERVKALVRASGGFIHHSTTSAFSQSSTAPPT